MRRETLAALAACVALTGCGASGLDVRYPPEGAHPALLAVAAPRSIAVGPVVDRRIDTTRVGTGPKDRPLRTSQPVAEVVREALVAELAANGHTAAPDAPIALAADVEAFSVDVVTGYGKTQYVGTVAIAVAVGDGRSQAPMLTRRYVGIKRQAVDKPSPETAADVLTVALARTMRDLATDPELAAVLAGGPGTAAPRSGALSPAR